MHLACEGVNVWALTAFIVHVDKAYLIFNAHTHTCTYESFGHFQVNLG